MLERVKNSYPTLPLIRLAQDPVAAMRQTMTQQNVIGGYLEKDDETRRPYQQLLTDISLRAKHEWLKVPSDKSCGCYRRRPATLLRTVDGS